MLHVQFDGEASPAARLEPPAGTVLSLRVRRIDDVLDGLLLRQQEPAVLARDRKDHVDAGFMDTYATTIVETALVIRVDNAATSFMDVQLAWIACD